MEQKDSSVAATLIQAKEFSWIDVYALEIPYD